MTPPTETGDFFGSVVDTIPTGGVEDVFIRDCVAGVNDIFSLALTEVVAFRYC
jgi:hypothetical protein